MFVKTNCMKKVLLLALIAISCQKQEIKPRSFVKSVVSFRSSYVNDKFDKGYDSIFIKVQGVQSFSFATYDNPCANTSFGFNTWHIDSVANIPYIISTDRDTLEMGLLTFTVNGFYVSKV